MKLTTFSETKTHLLHTYDPPIHQNTNTREAKKIMEQVQFWGGGAIRFLLNPLKRPDDLPTNCRGKFSSPPPPSNKSTTGHKRSDI